MNFAKFRNFSVFSLTVLSLCFSQKAFSQADAEYDDMNGAKILLTKSGSGYTLSYCSLADDDRTCKPILGAKNISLGEMYLWIANTDGARKKALLVEHGGTVVGAIVGGAGGAVLGGAPTLGLASVGGGVVGAGVGGALGTGIAVFMDPYHGNEIGEMDQVLNWAIQSSSNRVPSSTVEENVNLKAAAKEITSVSSAN